MTELILKDEVFAIIGAAIEVHRELEPGFLEAIYQEAMEIELASRNIPFLNYLKATGLRVGLLINFGSHGRLEWKRFVR